MLSGVLLAASSWAGGEVGVRRGFRVVLGAQLVVSGLAALVAGSLAGGHAALSAAIGGLIAALGVFSFALLSMVRAASPGDAIRVALRAEAAKLSVMVLLFWLVFTTYQDVVFAACVGTFVVSVLVSSVAFFVPED